MASRPPNKASWDTSDWGTYVQERSDFLYDEQEDYRKAAEGWENIWKLKAFEQSADQAEKEGKILTVPNDPYNIVKLTERLLGGRMRIDVIATDDTTATRHLGEKRELWLGGFWNTQQMETGINVRRQAIWWAAVRGRFALDVRWVKEVLPEYYKNKRLPVMVRCLDPLNVLQQDSEFGWPSYVIHRYEAPVYKIRERWGKPAYKALPEEEYTDDQMMPVHDYWDAEWNAVVVQGELMKKAVKHDYPRIPIILAYADATPLNESQWRGLSILYPIDALWRLKAKVWSYISTGLMWYFWPALFQQNDVNSEITPGLEITPGKTFALKPGEKVVTLNMNPNVPLAEIMNTAISGAIQDATYPRNLYGAEPGVELAGYALANLSSAARGRIGPLQEPMEWAFAQACELILDLVHDRGGGNVQVWTGQKDQPGYMLFNLKDAALEKHMPIKATISLDLPRDEQQRAVRGLQEIETGVLSRQTYREKFLSEVDNAELEGLRVLRDMVEKDERISKEMIAEAYRTLTGKRLPGEEEPMMPPQIGMPPGPPMEPPPGMPPMLPPGPPPPMGPPPPGPMPGPETGLPPGVLPPQAMMPAPPLPPGMLPMPPEGPPAAPPVPPPNVPLMG